MQGFKVAYEAIGLDFGDKLEKHCQSVLSRPLVKIITLYQPEPKLWIDNKVRKAT